MSWKDKALDSTAEKLCIAEESVALVVPEKDKQSADLTSFQKANEDLKVKLRDIDRKLKESESWCKVVENKVFYYESTEYTTKVVNIYQSSPKFEEELFNKSNVFYDRGCAHISSTFINIIWTRH